MTRRRRKPTAREIQEALSKYRKGLSALFLFNVIMMLTGITALVLIALAE